jgi:hypothetical protein
VQLRAFDKAVGGEPRTCVNPEARLWRKSFQRNFVGGRPSKRSPSFCAALSQTSIRSGWKMHTEGIPGERGYASGQRDLAFVRRGSAANLRSRFGREVPPLAVPNAKTGFAWIVCARLRIGLPMIRVGGAAEQMVTTIGKSLGLFWILGWSLPFFRVQPGRGHNCLTKLLERHLCAVCARRVL